METPPAAPELSGIEEFFQQNGGMLVDYGLRIVGAIALFIIGRWLASKLAKALSKRLTKRDFDPMLTRFAATMVRTLLLIIVILACLNIFGVQTTSVAAVLGAGALAIGIALQGSLSNFASGVLLIVLRPFNVGDLVEAGGKVGVIYEVGLFTTAVDTPNNVRIVIPNAQIFSGTIVNMSHNQARRICIPVGCDYGADIEATRKALETVITKVPSRVEGEAHHVFLSDLGGSSVNWEVRIFSHPDNYWDVWQETVQAVKEALDGVQISIPFPQMDLHIDGSLGGDKAA